MQTYYPPSTPPISTPLRPIYDPVSGADNTPVMRTETAVDAYMTAHMPNWAESTYKNKVEHFRKFIPACPMLPLAPEPIEAFLASIPGEQYRYNHWRTIRALYRWLVRRRLLTSEQNPCEIVEPPPCPKPQAYWLEEDELRMLLCHPSHSQRDRALLFLLADTGIRIGEAASMRTDKLGEDWIEVNGKAGRRFVPVTARVLDMVRSTIPEKPRGESGHVWYGKRGALTRQGLQIAVRMAFLRAGFQGMKMSPHRLRHTFATLWDGSDADGMDITGHTEWKTWRIYKTARVKRLTQSHSAHSPIAQLKLL